MSLPASRTFRHVSDGELGARAAREALGLVRRPRPALGVLLVTFVLVLSACAFGTNADSADGITIDRDVFAYREDVGTSNEMFVVTDAPAQAKVVSALNAAGARFMMVDEKGTEHPDEASLEAAFESGLYTPNYVSDPEVTPDGVELYIDCKGAIEEPMARTFRTILREELKSAGVRGHVRAVTP